MPKRPIPPKSPARPAARVRKPAPVEREPVRAEKPAPPTEPVRRTETAPVPILSKPTPTPAEMARAMRGEPVALEPDGSDPDQNAEPKS
jgi:hypothetical protein